MVRTLRHYKECKNHTARCRFKVRVQFIQVGGGMFFGSVSGSDQCRKKTEFASVGENNNTFMQDGLAGLKLRLILIIIERKTILFKNSKCRSKLKIYFK